jgi:hypothetical protein
VPEKRKKQDDRDWNANQPEQNAFTHEPFLHSNCGDNVCGGLLVPTVPQRV